MVGQTFTSHRKSLCSTSGSVHSRAVDHKQRGVCSNLNPPLDLPLTVRIALFHTRNTIVNELPFSPIRSLQISVFMCTVAILLCEHNYTVFSCRLWDIRCNKTPMFTIAAHEGKVLCLDWSLPKVLQDRNY